MLKPFTGSLVAEIGTPRKMDLSSHYRDDVYILPLKFSRLNRRPLFCSVLDLTWFYILYLIIRLKCTID